MKSAMPDQEQPPVAEEVAEPPAEQQEAAEREQVRVHDPGERRLARSRGPPGSTAARRSRSSRRGRSSGRRGRAREREPAGAGVEIVIGFLSGCRDRLDWFDRRRAELIGRRADEISPPRRVYRDGRPSADSVAFAVTGRSRVPTCPGSATASARSSSERRGVASATSTASSRCSHGRRARPAPARRAPRGLPGAAAPCVAGAARARRLHGPCATCCRSSATTRAGPAARTAGRAARCRGRT